MSIFPWSRMAFAILAVLLAGTCFGVGLRPSSASRRSPPTLPAAPRPASNEMPRSVSVPWLPSSSSSSSAQLPPSHNATPANIAAALHVPFVPSPPTTAAPGARRSGRANSLPDASRPSSVRPASREQQGPSATVGGAPGGAGQQRSNSARRLVGPLVESNPVSTAASSQPMAPQQPSGGNEVWRRRPPVTHRPDAPRGRGGSSSSSSGGAPLSSESSAPVVGLAGAPPGLPPGIVIRGVSPTRDHADRSADRSPVDQTPASTSSTSQQEQGRGRSFSVRGGLLAPPPGWSSPPQGHRNAVAVQDQDGSAGSREARGGPAIITVTAPVDMPASWGELQHHVAERWGEFQHHVGRAPSPAAIQQPANHVDQGAGEGDPRSQQLPTSNSSDSFAVVGAAVAAVPRGTVASRLRAGAAEADHPGLGFLPEESVVTSAAVVSATARSASSAGSVPVTPSKPPSDKFCLSGDSPETEGRSEAEQDELVRNWLALSAEEEAASGGTRSFATDSRTPTAPTDGAPAAATLDPASVLPPDLCCSLTLQPFQHPIVGEDGHTYDKGAFDRYYRTVGMANFSYPLTREPVQHWVPATTSRSRTAALKPLTIRNIFAENATHFIVRQAEQLNLSAEEGKRFHRALRRAAREESVRRKQERRERRKEKLRQQGAAERERIERGAGAASSSSSGAFLQGECSAARGVSGGMSFGEGAEKRRRSSSLARIAREAAAASSSSGAPVGSRPPGTPSGLSPAGKMDTVVLDFLSSGSCGLHTTGDQPRAQVYQVAARPGAFSSSDSSSEEEVPLSRPSRDPHVVAEGLRVQLRDACARQNQLHCALAGYERTEARLRQELVRAGAALEAEQTQAATAQQQERRFRRALRSATTSELHAAGDEVARAELEAERARTAAARTEETAERSARRARDAILELQNQLTQEREDSQRQLQREREANETKIAALQAEMAELRVREFVGGPAMASPTGGHQSQALGGSSPQLPVVCAAWSAPAAAPVSEELASAPVTRAEARTSEVRTSSTPSTSSSTTAGGGGSTAGRNSSQPVSHQTPSTLEPRPSTRDSSHSSEASLHGRGDQRSSSSGTTPSPAEDMHTPGAPLMAPRRSLRSSSSSSSLASLPAVEPNAHRRTLPSEIGIAGAASPAAADDRQPTSLSAGSLLPAPAARPPLPPGGSATTARDPSRRNASTARSARRSSIDGAHRSSSSSNGGQTSRNSSPSPGSSSSRRGSRTAHTARPAL